MFHMKRTAGTLVLQSLLPLTYLATVSYFTVILDHQYPSFTAFSLGHFTHTCLSVM